MRLQLGIWLERKNMAIFVGDNSIITCKALNDGLVIGHII